MPIVQEGALRVTGCPWSSWQRRGRLRPTSGSIRTRRG